MGACGSFLVVEMMRRGAPPVAAIREALERIATAGPLEPHHQVAFVAMTPDGTVASGALRSGFRCAVVSKTDQGVVEPELVLLSD